MGKGLSRAGLAWGVALAALAPVGAAHAQELAGAPAAPAAVGAPGPLRLEVSLSERVLRVFAGDSLLESYPVAVGKGSHPTPRGRFQIRRLIWNPSWVPPDAEWARGETRKGPGEPGNPMGRVKLFFSEPDYYIHGTEDQASLGRAASHGCVRMANADVVEVARLVMEHGGEPRPRSWFERILSRVRDSNEVRLQRPVPVVIRE